MPLTLYYHPLASFCWKPLIALYENNIPFTPLLVDLQDEVSRNNFLDIWPMGQFPVLKDEDKGRLIPQSTAIIEYLALHYRDPARRDAALIPDDPELAFEARRWNDFYDSYLQAPMQRIVGDALRAESTKDPIGVADARATLNKAYDVLEKQLTEKTWTIGELFTLADCAAAPAVFYANEVEPLGNQRPNLENFLHRLKSRPSFARVLREAEPFFKFFPYNKK